MLIVGWMCVATMCGGKKKEPVASTMLPSRSVAPMAPRPPAPAGETLKDGRTQEATAKTPAEKKPEKEEANAKSRQKSVGEGVKEEEKKEKEKQEDSFDRMTPRKAEAERAKEIKGEKVPNKGDYKTWADKMNQLEDDFDKPLSQQECK